MTTGLLPTDPVRVVVIDLGGVMVDTAGGFHAAISAVPEVLGAMPDMSSKEVVGYVDRGSEDLVRHVLDACLPSVQANSRFVEGLKAYQHTYITVNSKYVNVYEDVREGLAALCDMGFALACVTNKSYDFTQPPLAQLGLNTYSDLVYPGDALQYHGSGPYLVLRVTEAFDVVPTEIAAINDPKSDARTARVAGMCVLAVPYGRNHDQPIQGAGIGTIVGALFAAAKLVRPYAELRNAVSAASDQ